jgi:membrane-associated phospholipid phosphatase
MTNPFVWVGRHELATLVMWLLMLVTLSATAYFFLEGRYPEAGLLLIAVVGGILLSTLLKLGFDRPRPELVPHMSHVITASFPSGHTKLSAVTYLTLGALHIRLWGETIRVAAAVHTVGGLSAHADQAGLLKWRSKIENRPPVALVHGEEQAANGLSECLQERFGVPVRVARPEWSG